MRFSNHVNNVVFVDDDRGRVWAYDHTEEGNVFGMVSNDPRTSTLETHGNRNTWH